ncbi:MAG TPA: T9SS type A sorting domain-containing protein [Prolixibacteraceae bacterium]|nr:T9SS type A sorting domain-containing protein [Prolixibacteraceae bacterium]
MNKSFSAYPNPTTNTITINGLEKSQDYEVINLQGKVIMRGTADSETISIDLLGQENGIYLIRSGNVSRKILLMK